MSTNTLDWSVISFSKDGVITEFLATRKSIGYFAAEHNPKSRISEICMQDAFDFEALWNKERIGEAV